MLLPQCMRCGALVSWCMSCSGVLCAVLKEVITRQRLHGAGVRVEALGRVELPPCQLARVQRRIGHDMLAHLPRVAGEHLAIVSIAIVSIAIVSISRNR